MTRERRPRRERRVADAIKQLPWQRLVNRFKPMEILSADELEAIHRASLRILEELGLEVWSEQALAIFRRAGASVDASNSRVRLDRGLIEAAIKTVPREFTLYPRNRERRVTFGGQPLVFGSVGGPPHCSDLDGGRRPGTQKDFRNLVRLIQSLNVVHIVSGSPVAPIDLNAETRHLDMYYDFLTLTDRVWHATAIGSERIEDAINLLSIARGVSREELTVEPSMLCVINTNSPLRLDGQMAEGLIAAAAAGQAVILTPFTLAGAMAPTSLAGALAQQNAEALAGIALTQLVRPGAPAMYGGFTSNVDMRSGAPAFGTPEYTKGAMATGQLTRRYGFPYRSSNVNASNAVDAQAAYESQMAIWGSLLGGVNLLHHGVGWLEGGLVASFEKMIVDAEMLQMIAKTLEPIVVDEDSLALSAIKEVGPGGHFFGAVHTLAHYETAFYQPLLSDWRNFESWREAGSKTATERANTLFKALLESYEKPPIDPAIEEAMGAYVRRRKEEIGQRAA